MQPIGTQHLHCTIWGYPGDIHMSASSIAFEYCQRLVHRIAEHHKTRPTRHRTNIKDSGAICESLENRILLSGNQLVTFVDDSWATVVLGDDPDGAGEATEFGVDAFATIQEAIDATQANGTVHVADGTYDENISITSDLTLISDNGRDVTFINGISGVDALGTITIANATDVNIGDIDQGFTINGIDNGNPAVENAAIYINDTNSGIDIVGNEIIANGEAGLLTEYGMTVTDLTIDNNIFSGQTFEGSTAGGLDFDSQFTENNVPRQLVAINGGSGSTNANISFTNNQVTGTAGGLNDSAQEQGNSLVTIDAINSTISYNTFEGTTTRYGSALRARGSRTSLIGNTFNSDGMGNDTNHLYTDVTTLNGLTGGALNKVISNNTFDGGAYINGTGAITVGIESIIENAPDLSTVNILAGEYDADITISNNSVKVLGPNADIAPDSTLRRPEAIINGGFRIQGNYNTINGLTVQNGIGPAGIGDITAFHIASGVLGTTIAYSNITGTDQAGSRGIVTSAGADAYVQYSNISGWATGIYLNPVDAAGKAFLLYNNIHDNVVGLSSDGMAGTLNVAMSFFANNTFEHIGLGTPSGEVNIILNSFDANGPSISNYGGSEIDASYNWWGTTDLSLVTTNITANASGPIDYSPILNSGTDIEPDTYGFQTVLDNVTAHQQGSQTTGIIDEALTFIEDNGTIILDGDYTGDVIVGYGIILGGDFTLNGTLTLQDGATLAPGNSPAIVNTGDLTMGTGETLAIELFGTTPGTEHDQVNVTGTVDITDATLDLTLGYYPSTSGDSFVIINNDDADAITGTFSGLAEGATVTMSYGGTTFDATITYVGGDGNDVVLTTDAYALNNVTVDDDWASLALGDDPDGAGPLKAFGFDAFANIQDAINAVDANGTVHVNAGSYDPSTEFESLPGYPVNGLYVDKAVTLLGANAGINPNTGIRSAESIITGSVFILSDNVLFDGFELTDGVDAWSPTNAVGKLIIGNEATHTTLQNLYVHDIDFGIGPFTGHEIILLGNDEFSGGSASNTTIVDNQIEGDIYFYHNTISSSDEGTWSDTLIQNNTIESISSGNFYNDYSWYYNFDNLDIVDNQIGGIDLRSLNDAWIENNTITSGINVTGSGKIFSNVFANGSTLTLSLNNSLKQTAYASFDVFGNFFTYNTDPSQAGTAVINVLRGAGASNNHINFNSFTDGGARNDANAVINQDGYGSVLDLSTNWWDTTDINEIVELTFNPLIIEDSPGVFRTLAQGLVDTSPFLESGVDTNTGTAGFQGDYSALTVHQSGAQTTELIAEGVNEIVASGTLTVAPGVYDENVYISAGVTIAGIFTNTGPMRFGAGSTFSPGNSPAIANTGDLTLDGGSTLEIELLGTTPGSEHDQVNVTGTVDIIGAALDVDLLYVPTGVNEYTIINNDDTDAVTGSFNGLAEGATFTVNGIDFVITYTGGDGNDVVLTATNIITPVTDVYVDDSWSSLSFGVDPDGAGGATAFGIDAFATLQEGVDAVGDGYSVFIHDGTYAETVAIDSNLTLEGISGIAADVIIAPTTAGNGITVSQTATELTFKNFTVTGASADGINATGNGSANYTITNVVTRANGDDGFDLTQVGDIVFTDSIGSDNLGTGMEINRANSLTDTNGKFNFNNDGGIVTFDILNNAIFTRTILNSNDNNDDGTGDGFNASKSTTAYAIGGNLTFNGIHFNDIDGAGTTFHQNNGIVISDIAGNVLIQSHDNGSDIKRSDLSGHDDKGADIKNIGGTVDIIGGAYYFNTSAGITLLNITGHVTIDGAAVQENSFAITGGHFTGTIINNDIQYNNTGIGLGNNVTASIIGNQITHNDVGLTLIQSTALLENNDLSDNNFYAMSVGQNSLVDAGDSFDDNVTGLGTGSMTHGSSAGNNDFTGYLSSSFGLAIINANLVGMNAPDVLAEMNQFGFIGHNDIENLIEHQADNPLLTEVFFDYALPSQTVTDVYVDDDWNTVALFADPDGAGPATQMGIDAFYTIQDAIDAVADGGTVHVYDGTYVEEIYIEHDLTITGVSQNATGVIIDGQNSFEPISIYDVDNVTIEYLTVTNSDDDNIDIEYSGQVTLNHIISTHAGDDGIDVSDVETINIFNTTIDLSAENGIDIEYIDTANISDTIITHSGHNGIKINDAFTLDMDRVTVNGATEFGIDSYFVQTVDLTDVTVTNAMYDGIWIDFTVDATLTNVTSQYNAGDGIYLTTVQNIDLLDSNASYNALSGIYVELAETFTDTNGVYTENEDSGIFLDTVLDTTLLTRTTATNNNADFGDFGAGLEFYGASLYNGPAPLDIFYDPYGPFYDPTQTPATPIYEGSLTIQGGTFSDTDGYHPVTGATYSQTQGIIIEYATGDITLEAHDNTTDIQTTSITGNTVNGLTIAHSTSNVTISDADVSYNKKAGMDIKQVEAVSISDTSVIENHFFGIWIWVADSIALANMDVQYNHTGILAVETNTFTDTNSYFANNRNAGMEVDNVTQVFNITESSIIDNGTAGLFLTDLINASIQQSTLSGNDIGVRLQDGIREISFTNNYITNNNIGIQVNELRRYSSTITVFDNDLSNNATYAIQNIDIPLPNTITIANASGNWWGSNEETAIMAMTDGVVDFTPFLNIGTDMSADPGFQGDFSALKVTTLGEQTSGGRAQEGVDMADDDGTITLIAGTYNEDITVNKNKTLKGHANITGDITLMDSAVLATGTSPGLITLSNLNTSANHTIEAEIEGLIPGTEYDQIIVTESVTLDNANLTVSLSYDLTENQTFTIIDNQGDQAVNGTFAGLEEGQQFLVNDLRFTITYQGGDGNDVQLIFHDLNAAPVASDVLSTTFEDADPITASFVADDEDFNDTSASLIYTILSSPSKGTVINHNDGTFTFDPQNAFQDLAAGQTRQVSFTYIATDANGHDSDVATVTITVTGTNDAVKAVPDLTSTVSDTPIDIDVLANDIDIDGDTLQVSAVDVVSKYGVALSINADGTIHYAPSGYFDDLAPGQTIRDSFTYTATDAAGSYDTHVVFINVTAPEVLTPSLASLNVNVIVHASSQAVMAANQSAGGNSLGLNSGTSNRNVNQIALAWANQQASLNIASTPMQLNNHITLQNQLDDADSENKLKLTLVSEDAE